MSIDLLQKKKEKKEDNAKKYVVNYQLENFQNFKEKNT